MEAHLPRVRVPLLVAAGVMLALTGLGVRSNTSVANAASTCTQIVGFSQTMQWYFGSFREASGGTWELRWVGGGSIGNWADPSYVGWQDSYLADSCSQNGSTPDRGLINVSGDYNTDPDYWAQETRAAITNLRAKYPSIQQVIVQPVVGGPGGGECTYNGEVVRASSNFPYIDEGLDRLANGVDIIKGISATVRTCADYADDMGHLTDQAKGPIGVSIANYYASGGSSAAPRPPAATATPVPATSTPIATATPVPTARTAPSQTVNFDNLSNPNRTLNGQYPTGTIDWGSNSWYLSGPYGQFQTYSIGFNGAAPHSATFSFIGGARRVVQVDAYNGGSSASDVILSCNGVRATEASVPPHTTQTLPMGWIGACHTVTFESSNGWITNFDNLLIDDGGSSPAPTATATSTPLAATATATTQAATATALSTSTATPSATATRTATPTVAATSTPTATPTFLGTVTFNDLASPNRALNGAYPSGVIDWGANAWYLVGADADFPSNHIRFNGAGSSRGFTFVSPRRLLRVAVHNSALTPTTVTLDCAGQQTASAWVLPGQTTSITTGWSGSCSTVTVGSLNGSQTSFDDFVLQ